MHRYYARKANPFLRRIRANSSYTDIIYSCFGFIRPRESDNLLAQDYLNNLRGSPGDTPICPTDAGGTVFGTGCVKVDTSAKCVPFTVGKVAVTSTKFLSFFMESRVEIREMFHITVREAFSVI